MAKNQQVVGSITDGVIGIFQSHNPSGRTMALGSNMFKRRSTNDSKLRKMKYVLGKYFNTSQDGGARWRSC